MKNNTCRPPVSAIRLRAQKPSGHLMPRIMTIALMLISLASLVIIDIMTAKGGYEDLYFVYANDKAHSIPLEELDEFEDNNAKRLMLTYEVKEKTAIEAINKRYDVTLVITNSSYPFVTDYRMISGGFFTGNATEQDSKLAVMDEQAAFAVFASTDIVGNELRIGGSYFTVVGVINDDTKEQNVYIPAANPGETADSFLSKTDIVSEAMKNELKKAGMGENAFTAADLGTLAGIIREKVLFSSGLVLMLLILILLKKTVGTLKQRRCDICESMKIMYFDELLKKEPKKILGFGLVCTALLLEAVSLPVIGSRLFYMALKWKDYEGSFEGLTSTSFSERIGGLRELLTLGGMFFTAFIVSVVIMVILIMVKGRKDGES